MFSYSDGTVEFVAPVWRSYSMFFNINWHNMWKRIFKVTIQPLLFPISPNFHSEKVLYSVSDLFDTAILKLSWNIHFIFFLNRRIFIVDSYVGRSIVIFIVTRRSFVNFKISYQSKNKFLFILLVLEGPSYNLFLSMIIRQKVFYYKS